MGMRVLEAGQSRRSWQTLHVPVVCICWCAPPRKLFVDAPRSGNPFWLCRGTWLATELELAAGAPLCPPDRARRCAARSAVSSAKSVSP
eukprot:280747-Chlamydomonas_euryale.AAC.2